MDLPTILIVDDDEDYLGQIVGRLGATYRCVTAVSRSEALETVGRESPEVVLLDLEFHEDSQAGFQILRELQGVVPLVPVVMLTRFDKVDLALEAIRGGAEDYLLKSHGVGELKLRIERALREGRLRRHSRARTESEGLDIPRLIGNSAAIRQLIDKVERCSSSDVRVLITGERGVGKDVVAYEIHRRSGRAVEPFVMVSCPSVQTQLAESELFGHEKGAFTDAKETRIGKVEIATKGTLFLNEIAHLDAHVQAKLLTVLDYGAYERLGGTRTLRTGARVMAATNRDLPTLVERGVFLPDLYDRLNQVHIHVPPLRQRREDIPALVNHFLHAACVQQGRDLLAVEKDVIPLLQSHHWPGNVRELRNKIDTAVALSGARVLRRHDFLLQGVEATADASAGILTYKEARKAALREFQREYLRRVLRDADGNASLAARRAGIHRASLARMARDTGLTQKD
ncbi:MAG: sigma-54-dependent Fis family transcriptional regulator [Candidatus Eisenbacteria bacterium]|nr:sigma-54-dependent Fis family transcriptional regulator [Candidatus Eisenbacteria bacterium]